MTKFFLFISLFFISFNSYSQDVFDLGVRQIEIFFNEPNWDDSLDIYFANNNGERLIADSILIDGIADQNVGIKYRGNNSPTRTLDSGVFWDRAVTARVSPRTGPRR